MTTMTMERGMKGDFCNDDLRRRAVAQRDARADGEFVYAVRTTGVYCRPTCAAKLARRENVKFYATAEDAERAGFRACKRCRPNESSVSKQHAAAVARACRLIARDSEECDLASLADAVGMSASHFHRIFKSVTGVTPKAYAMARRSERAREELARGGNVTAAIFKAGFHSSGRFYADSSSRLGMKPAEFRSGGKGAKIRFAVGECELGSILVAASEVGICSIALGDDPNDLVRGFEVQFSKAELIGGDRDFERLVARVIAFVDHPAKGLGLPLEVRGTVFQQRVWQKLCEIPCGETWSYAKLAKNLGAPNGSRAVARACAANPVAVAIPCHRVVRTDGSLSGYRWGIERKAKLLEAERKLI